MSFPTAAMKISTPFMLLANMVTCAIAEQICFSGENDFLPGQWANYTLLCSSNETLNVIWQAIFQNCNVTLLSNCSMPIYHKLADNCGSVFGYHPCKLRYDYRYTKPSACLVEGLRHCKHEWFSADIKAIMSIIMGGLAFILLGIVLGYHWYQERKHRHSQSHHPYYPPYGYRLVTSQPQQGTSCCSNDTDCSLNEASYSTL